MSRVSPSGALLSCVAVFAEIENREVDRERRGEDGVKSGGCGGESWP